MRPQGSWFFEGYKRVEQPKKNGNGTRQVLVYVGEYYGFPGGAQVLRKRKTQSVLATVLCLFPYFYAQFFPSTGGMNRLVGLFGILALFPMIFFVMGLGNFLFAKEEWEIRVYYAGYRRMTRWGIAQAVILGLWTLAELAFLVLHRSLLAEELPYFLAALVSFGANLWLVWLVRKNPAIVVRGPEVT
jgi:hypothetical protein